MPRKLNQTIVADYAQRFTGSDLVAVDITGLSVAEAEDLRRRARGQSIEVFVVKTSLALIVLKSALPDNGVEAIVAGPTALLYGGPEGLPSVARLVGEFRKKTGKLAVRGGIFEKKPLTPADVERFRELPDRQTLLGQVLGTLVAPLSGVARLMQALLSAPASLTESLIQKKQKSGEGS